MLVNTELHLFEYIKDEYDGPGASTMSSNIYIEFAGIMPSQKYKAHAIISKYYADLSNELKNIV